MAGQSTYTLELGNAICERLATGDMSLRAVARELGISHSTILFWALREPAFADQYARACEIRDDAAFEGLEDMMAQEPERVTVTIGEDATKTSVDSGWVAWQRERKDALKWSLAKRRPKKYGERIEQVHSGTLTLESLVTSAERS